MSEQQLEAPPQNLARVGGVLYLIIIVGGLFGEVFIRTRLIVAGDATATAANIRSMEALWRFGIALEFFMLTCTVVLALILFVLLRPVNRDLALLAIFFNLISVAVEAGNELQLAAALFPLENAGYLGAFEPEQLYTMVSLSLRLYGYGFGAGLIFGCECLVIGYLLFRSDYFPRLLGVLMQIAGLCYLTNSFALILAPIFANQIFPAILLPAFVGEATLCLWLLVKGINVEKWKAQASANPMQSAAATL